MRAAFVPAALCAWLVAALAAPAAAVDRTWTAAGSPYLITEDLTIPPGDTLTLEPGVIVTVQNGAQLFVQGTLTGAGTAASPVTITGVASFPTKIVVTGVIDLSGAVIEILVQPNDGGTLRFTDTVFQAGGTMELAGAPSYIWRSPPYIELDRCEFQGTRLWVDTCTAVLRDTSVSGGFVSVASSYLRAENLTVDGSPTYGLSLWSYEQPVYLDALSVTNSAGAGLDLVDGNFLLGASLVLQGNDYPVRVGGAGILAGSVAPASGNANDAILVQDAAAGASSMVWADAGLPYVVRDTYTAGTLRVLPGAVVRLGPAATFWGEPGFVRLRGRPEAPVTFERLDPTQAWQGLQYFHRIEGAVIDGGEIGARFHSSSGPGYIDDSIIRNCDFGTQNNVVVRKTRFENNGTGSWNDGWGDALNGATGANSFEGNGIAVDGAGGLVDARFNWWGDPSGPASTDNPGGAGDPVAPAGVSTTPFLTAPPDFADHPPIVEMNDTFFLAEPGRRILLGWGAEDDGGVVAQRVEFDDPLAGTSVLAELDGTARSFEWLVPDVGVVVNNVLPVVRVVAIDASGQEGWDQNSFLIPAEPPQGTLTVTSDLSGPFRAGDDIGELCWDAQGLSPIGSMVSAALYFDGDRRAIGLGGVTTYLNCLSGTVTVPFVSTDTARIVLTLSDGLNRMASFTSDTFAIRPDARVGDAPPAVTMTSPLPGDSYPGGGAVPIAWTASDDEALRAFDVQASFDGGFTWHFIAQDLPATATGFPWLLPSSAGVAGVRVRVLATDLRYQTSSHGSAVSFDITPGSAGTGGCTESPGEVVRVDLDGTALRWATEPGADWYDVARGAVSVAGSAPSPACAAAGLSGASYDDGLMPSVGEVLTYVVRAGNACGAGPWGWGTGGTARTASCP